MPNYIRDVLLIFTHKQPKSPQYSSHEHTPIKYGQKSRQYVLQPDISERLDKHSIKYIQQVTGALLYYAHALD